MARFFQKGSNKTRFQHCKNSNNVLLYVRAIELIALELMNHVAIPLWKEFLYHIESSFNVNSILQERPFAVGTLKKGEKHLHALRLFWGHRRRIQ